METAMEAYVGEVRWFAFNFAPEGWAACDGAMLQIRQNQVLFALIGTTFGGDGSATYALPKIASANGLNAFIALRGVFPPRS
jgi:microcystin-dependent protein